MNSSGNSDRKNDLPVREMFQRITPHYDLLNRILSARRDVYWRRRAVGLFPERLERALDVAAGTGDLAVEIARLRLSCTVDCVDFAPRMLSIARRKAVLSRTEARLNYIVGDAMQLPFDDAVFDVAAIAFGLRNIPDRLGAIKEMVRVVSSGGKVLVLEMTFPENIRLKRFFKWYLKRVIPFIGGVISSERRAYRYLSDSIKGFLHPDEMNDLFKEAGLVEIQEHPLTFGICYIHEGVVKESSLVPRLETS